MATLLGTACVPAIRSGRHDVAERAATDWTATLAQVDVEMAAGRYAVADRLLVDFQQNHPGTPELADAALRRALFMLDPANPSASPADAHTLLDSLLTVPVEGPQRTSALALKRVATALETRPVVVRNGAPAAAPPAGAAPGTLKPDEARAKDDEIAHLKDELARANAELERIRRRIATPKP